MKKFPLRELARSNLPPILIDVCVVFFDLFFARCVGVLFGNLGSIFSLVVLTAYFSIVYRLGKPYFPRYRGTARMRPERLEMEDAVLRVERLEYVPAYLVFSLVVLSCHGVFLFSMPQNCRLRVFAIVFRLPVC